MENEKILRKISALMNVTVQNGATVDEALTAAKKAQELIAKYHVTILENPTEKENVGEKNIEGSRKWIQLLANIVCANIMQNDYVHRKQKNIFEIYRQRFRPTCRRKNFSNVARSLSKRNCKRKNSCKM